MRPCRPRTKSLDTCIDHPSASCTNSKFFLGTGLNGIIIGIIVKRRKGGSAVVHPASRGRGRRIFCPIPFEPVVQRSLQLIRGEAGMRDPARPDPNFYVPDDIPFVRSTSDMSKKAPGVVEGMVHGWLCGEDDGVRQGYDRERR
jgi:hypothetical protein